MFTCRIFEHKDGEVLDDGHGQQQEDVLKDKNIFEPGLKVIKLFVHFVKKVRNKLECLSPASLSSIV